MAWLFGFLLVVIVGLWWFLIRMPGENYAARESPPPALLSDLKRDIEHLAGSIGERNVFTPEALAASADWIDAELRKAGYAPKRQTFEVSGTPCSNIEVEIPGSDEIVVIGGHYDSVQGCPGANDNGTVAFVGNIASRALVHESIAAFRQRATIPSEGIALFEAVPGVGWSDHWAFWQSGYPAIMVTDTAPFRYPHYHRRTDTPDQIHYEGFARVVEGCEAVVEKLARVQPR